MLFWKLSVVEIPLDKEFAANYLEETCAKLEELIPVDCGTAPLTVIAVPVKWYVIEWCIYTLGP